MPVSRVWVSFLIKITLPLEEQPVMTVAAITMKSVLWQVPVSITSQSRAP